MTVRVHVLSDGFRAPNARAFAFPLIRHRDALAQAGIALRFFARDEAALTECDLLCVDSKHFTGPERGAPSHVLAQLERWRARREATVWFDTTDSAGWIFEGALKTTKAYYKNQVLRERTRYLEPMHGRRAPSDFYHRTVGIRDPQPDAEPQVSDPELLGRLYVGWNSGLADYSRHGPLLMAAYQRLRAPVLLRWPRFHDAGASRPMDVSCRFGTAYERASVAYQREEIRRRLSDRLPTEKVGRGAYMRELRDSRIVVSPFGLGEITLKDFETLLSGALLLKPDMDHMETWPDIYKAGETMQTFCWDLSDLEAVIEASLAQTEECKRIAAQGQKLYADHLNDETGREKFVARFRTIVERTLH